MGRLSAVTPVEELVKNNVETFIKDSTSSYPSFMETAPIFVTYYSKAAFKSEHDVEFEAFNEIAGAESPIRFHRIEKLPLYALDVSDFNTELGEDGWTGNVQSSAIILPNTIVPKPDDLIELEIHSKKLLFVVTNGTGDNYGVNKFFKINFTLSSYTKVEADKATDEEFVIDYNLIGKQENVLIKRSFHQYVEDIRYIYDRLLNSYTAAFFDKGLSLVCNKDYRVVDPLLNQMILKHNLLTPFVAYRNTHVITPSLSRFIPPVEYKNSPFRLIESNKYSELRNNKYMVGETENGQGMFDLMYFLRNKYKITQNFGVKHPDCDVERPTLYHIDYSWLSTDITDFDSVNTEFLYKYAKLIANSDSYGKIENGVKMIDEDLTEAGKVLLMDILGMIKDLEEVANVFYAEVTKKYIQDYYLIPNILLVLKDLLGLITKTES